MIPFRRRVLYKAYKFFDVFVMAASFILTTSAVKYQSSGISIRQIFSMRIKIENLMIFACLVLVWNGILSTFGLYRSKRLSRRSTEVLDVTKANTVATAAIFIISKIFKADIITPGSIILFWVTSTTLMSLARFFFRYILSILRRRGRNLRHILIVGTNDRAIELAGKIVQKKDLGYRIVGFADSNWPGTEKVRQLGYKLASSLENLPVFLRNNVIDEVFICLPMKSFYDQATRVVSLCQEHGITLRFQPNIFNSSLGNCQIGKFEDSDLVILRTNAFEGWPAIFKRLFDIVVSSVLLIILAPLYLIVAILIMATSEGPMFFTQDRIGLNKRIFRLYKFRTMVKDAEAKIENLQHLNEVSGPVFKISNDPRITPIGQFLRKTSIDELPQLLNILKGDMSLVGPRPLPVKDYEGFEQDWHRRRFSVRPGLTCLWQIRGRSNIPFEVWMKMDMEYIDNWSFWKDIKIIWQTIPAVLYGKGAS